MELARLDTLSPRECDCLRAYDDLGDAGAVAARLGLSTNTVNNHLKAARSKLGMTSSRAAARLLRVRDGGHPLTSPPLGIPLSEDCNHFGFSADRGDLLRDSHAAVAWGEQPKSGPPEGRNIAPEPVMVGLRNVAMAMVALVAAVVLVAWLMKAVPTLISASTFQN